METEEGEWKLMLDNMKIWGEKVWEVVSEKGGEVGEEHVRQANEKVSSKVKREELKEGDLVVKMFMRKRSGLSDKV